MSLTADTKSWLKKNADISLHGKTVVVTGANSGVGYKTAETMLYLGAHVILACRNRQRAEAARDTLASEYPGAEVSVMALDLADFASIDSFVSTIREQRVDIDVFVNNAGVFHQPGKKTKQGLDLVLGTNYFGVYYLTERLLPYLTSLPHKVTYINTISLAHKFATLGYKDFYFTKKYRSVPVYSRSKLCLAKYTWYTARKLEGGPVRMYMNHPGIAITPLGMNAVGARYARYEKVANHFFNSPEKSSLSIAFILSHDFPAGSIAGPVKGFGGWGYPKRNRIRHRVKTGAEELIAFTENEIKRVAMTGQRNCKLVLFDLDGTLLDTLDDLSEAVNHALRLRGLPEHTRDEYMKMVGHGVRNLVKAALPAEKQVDDSLIDSALADFKAYYTAHIDVHTHPYPGMVEVVRRLHEAGVQLAVASNKFQEGAEYLVGKMFPGIPFAAVLGNRPGFPLKPDPEIVGEVLRRTGVRPEDAVLVGDSPTDMKTAANGGIDAIAVTWGYRPMRDYPGVMVVESAEELLGLLRG